MQRRNIHKHEYLIFSFRISHFCLRHTLEIIEIKDDNAHIRCTGILIVDGYADPIEKEYFEIDSLIPIIESVDDWKKFGL